MAMERGSGEAGASWKAMKFFGSEQFLRGMWKYVTFERAGARIILSDVFGKNKKESTVSWNRSHPSKRLWNNSRDVRMQIAVTRRRVVRTSQ